MKILQYRGTRETEALALHIAVSIPSTTYGPKDHQERVNPECKTEKNLSLSQARKIAQ